MKQFTKGDDPRRNTNGRPKGTPNKSTDELRSMLRDFLAANLDKLQNDFDLLEPKDRLQFIDRVARLILPPPINELERLPPDQLNDLYQRLEKEMKSNIKGYE